MATTSTLNSDTMVTKPCVQCGKDVTRKYPSQFKEVVTCSRACTNKWRSAGPVTKPCDSCGELVTRPSECYFAFDQVACSQACQNKLRARGPITKPCPGCGEPVTKQYESQFRHGGWCSYLCMRTFKPYSPPSKGTRDTWVTMACKGCGTENEVPRHYASRYSYCSHECAAEHGAFPGRPRMEERPRDELGEYMIFNGYKHRYMPGHPMANASGAVAEHRRVVHDAGIEIPPGYHVDHINQDRSDNRLENLQVLSAEEHIKKTTAERQANRRKHAEYVKALELEVMEYRARYGMLRDLEQVLAEQETV